MQQVNFPMELVIADDFSTDGTRDIIVRYKTEYPEFIKLIFQEKNVGAAQNWETLMCYPSTKYIAYFEGDDYWTEPYKLQMQVDMLEADKDCGLVHTNIETLYERTGVREELILPRQEGYIFDTLLKANQIYSLTVVMQTKLVQDAIRSGLFTTFKLVGDYPLWLYISTRSKIKYIDKVTSLYRVLNESAFNTRNPIKAFILREEVTRIKLMFAENYQTNPATLPFLIGEIRGHLYFAGINRLPDSAHKAFSFLKKNKQIKCHDHILNFLSKSNTAYKLIVILKKIKHAVI